MFLVARTPLLSYYLLPYKFIFVFRPSLGFAILANVLLWYVCLTIYKKNSTGQQADTEFASSPVFFSLKPIDVLIRSVPACYGDRTLSLATFARTFTRVRAMLHGLISLSERI